jgi:alanine racemase
MDMIMVDVTSVNVKEGDAVEIIGEHQSLSSFAQKMHTIPYEVLTSISSRVHRVYVES